MNNSFGVAPSTDLSAYCIVLNPVAVVVAAAKTAAYKCGISYVKTINCAYNLNINKRLARN